MAHGRLSGNFHTPVATPHNAQRLPTSRILGAETIAASVQSVMRSPRRTRRDAEERRKRLRQAPIEPERHGGRSLQDAERSEESWLNGSRNAGGRSLQEAERQVGEVLRCAKNDESGNRLLDGLNRSGRPRRRPPAGRRGRANAASRGWSASCPPAAFPAGTAAAQTGSALPGR